MSLLLTILLTFALVVVALVVFVRFGTPYYLLKEENLEALLTLMVEGRATDSDWQVFLGVPIRHNERLEMIRQRCVDIDQREYVGGTGFLLTRRGIDEVKQLLDELKGEQ